MENFNHESEEELEETFKVLSNPNRLKILCMLSECEENEATVGDIAEKINITQPAASQHLKLLKSLKVVKSTKRGNNIYYKINTNKISQDKKCIDTLFKMMLNE